MVLLWTCQVKENFLSMAHMQLQILMQTWDNFQSALGIKFTLYNIKLKGHNLYVLGLFIGLLFYFQTVLWNWVTPSGTQLESLTSKLIYTEGRVLLLWFFVCFVLFPAPCKRHLSFHVVLVLSGSLLTPCPPHPVKWGRKLIRKVQELLRVLQLLLFWQSKDRNRKQRKRLSELTSLLLLNQLLCECHKLAHFFKIKVENTLTSRSFFSISFQSNACQSK